MFRLVSHPLHSSTDTCLNPLVGGHADLENQSNKSSERLIHPNWWMRSSIWNGCPSGMAPPPLLPSECHPRLICTNLINTLTGTPGLFTGGSVVAVVRTHTCTHTCARLLPRWAFDSSEGGRQRMMIALNLNTLTLTGTRSDTHTLLHAHTHKMYVPLLVWVCGNRGLFQSPIYI